MAKKKHVSKNFFIEYCLGYDIPKLRHGFRRINTARRGNYLLPDSSLVIKMLLVFNPTFKTHRGSVLNYT
jgi:hypothetical protein